MSADPRAALATLVTALERHLEACASRSGENDPTVIAAYSDLADAFDAYDEALDEAYDEVTPLMVYNDEFDLSDDDDDDDDDEDDDDLDDDEDDELDDDDLDEDDDDDDDDDDDADDDDEDDELDVMTDEVVDFEPVADNRPSPGPRG